MKELSVMREVQKKRWGFQGMREHLQTLEIKEYPYRNGPGGWAKKNEYGLEIVKEWEGEGRW